MNPRNRKTILGLRPKTHATIIIILLVTVIAVFLSWFWEANFVKTVYAERLVRPTYETPKSPTNEQKEIIAYIEQIFGEDSGKAFKVLSCENKSLNPNAMHDNEKWGQGKGKDFGVFQINDHWQGVQGKFLKNWKVNVEIAYQIFKENGDFHLWTCGRKFGI